MLMPIFLGKLNFIFYNFYSNVQLFNAGLIFYVILYLFAIHISDSSSVANEVWKWVYVLSSISEVEGGKKTKYIHSDL